MEKQACQNDCPAHAHHHHGAVGAGPWRLAAQSTFHCLTGCIIGELVGVFIGIEAGLSAAITIILATALSYVSGFMLGLWPVMRERGLSLAGALKII